MVLFIVLGTVVFITFAVWGTLFYMLQKEGRKTDEQKAVPLTDLGQLKKEFSSQPSEPKDTAVNIPATVASFETKVSLPTQEVLSPLEDEIYKKRAQELEGELRGISQRAQGQSDEAKQLIESLSRENELLRAQKAELEEARHKLTALQTESSGLKTENIRLESQLEVATAKVRSLEEEMAAVKTQMGDEIKRANTAVSELNRDKNTLLSAPKPAPDEMLRREMESLKAEHLQLKHKYEDLERTHQKLRELNTHLAEKNDLLQHELIQARAQSSGLERVSFNYKNQLEGFIKKVYEVQQQNEELAKKDQEAHSELEKNRLRLLDLEREYKDLKASLQKKDHS